MNFSWYGIIVGLAFVTTLWIADFLLKKAKAVDQNTSVLSPLFLILVGGGSLIGARLYHLLTDWPLYTGRPWWEWLAVWRGGLGIFGAIVGGLIGVAWWKKIVASRLTWPVIMDIAALSLPWGQAIGRWGNFTNQELFGPPTTLPWGIFIAATHRPPAWAQFTHFHPLFLYESIGTLFIGLNLLFIWHHTRSLHQKTWPLFRLGGGVYVGLYGLSYGLLRFCLEFGRWQPATGWLGLTVAQWVSIGLALIALGWLWWRQRAATTPVKKTSTKSRRLMAAVILIAGALLLTRAAAVRAQDRTPFDLTISPSVVEMRVQPGKSVTQAFLIENAGAVDLEVTATLRDFAADGQTGRPLLQDKGSFPYAALENADRKLDQPFLLPANASQQLVLGIHPPATAETKDWYTVLLIQTKPSQQIALGAQSSGQTRGNIAANLIIAVSPTDTTPATWQIKLARLPKFVDSLQTVTFRPVVTNTAATFAVPDLKLLVLNWQHNIVYEAAGLPDRILANSSREIMAAVTRKDDPRSLDAAPFTFHPLFALGPYIVRTTIRNNAEAPLVTEQTFYAFPFSLSGGLVFFLTMIVVIRFLQRKKTIK
jgi:phosphatidylglycerol:prolipoprotein diacylglycerol transferase